MPSLFFMPAARTQSVFGSCPNGKPCDGLAAQGFITQTKKKRYRSLPAML